MRRFILVEKDRNPEFHSDNLKGKNEMAKWNTPNIKLKTGGQRKQ